MLEEIVRKLPLRIIRDIHIKIEKDQLKIIYDNKETDVLSLTEDMKREYGEKTRVEKKDGLGLYILSKIMLPAQ